MNEFLRKRKNLSTRRESVQVNIALDYVVQETDRKHELLKFDRQITDFLLRNAVGAKYVEGIKDRAHQKTWSRILKALTRAVIAKHDAIELERGQVEWLLISLNDWSCPQGQVPWLCDLRDHLEDLLKAADEAPKNGVARTEKPESAKT